MQYLKIWCSFQEIIEPLSDEEVGRLIKMMLRYAETGETPTQSDFKGNERFIWAIAKQNIDYTETKSETLRRNGSQGGRPKSNQNQEEPEETKQNQEKANEIKENQIKPNESYKDKDKEKENDKENIKEKTSGRFTPPTIEQVKEYCKERGNAVDPDRWFNYYSSNGWKVGKNPMKDWKAAVRTWENNEKQDNRPAGKVVQVLPAQNYNQRSYNETKDVNAFYAELMKRQETS